MIPPYRQALSHRCHLRDDDTLRIPVSIAADRSVQPPPVVGLSEKRWI
jgi:hypothetical protein